MKQLEVMRLRGMYPQGTKIKLVEMRDIQAPKPGTKGVVSFIDDMGQIHVKWETGSSLALIPGLDKFETYL